jgi:hypothetical protein
LPALIKNNLNKGGEVMKAINNIPSRETGTVLLKHRKSIKGLYCWLSKHCITMFLAIFLLMIVAPVDASTGSGKNKKCGCRFKQTSFSYPVIIKANKKSSVHNKNLKKSRNRNYSFPV